MKEDKTKDDEATKVPIPDRWPWRPTRKGMQGRSWKWWLPNRHSFDDIPGAVWVLIVICLGTILACCILGGLGIL